MLQEKEKEMLNQKIKLSVIRKDFSEKIEDEDSYNNEDFNDNIDFFVDALNS